MQSRNVALGDVRQAARKRDDIFGGDDDESARFRIVGRAAARFQICQALNARRVARLRLFAQCMKNEARNFWHHYQILRASFRRNLAYWSK